MVKILNLHNFIYTLDGNMIIEIATYDEDDKREVLYSGKSFKYPYSDCDNVYGDCVIITSYISDNKLIILI